MKKPAKQPSPKLVGHPGRFALSAVVLVSIAYVFVGLFSVHRVRTKSVLRQGPSWNTARFHAPSGFERSIE